MTKTSVSLAYAPEAPLVVLSPHFDDAVLSCWTVLVRHDLDVIVVNVFARIPQRGILSEWDRGTISLRIDRRLLVRARRLGRPDSAARTPRSRDSAWLVGRRIAEDRRALAAIGRAPVNLSLLDAQYRAHPAYSLPDPAPSEITAELIRHVPRASAVLLPAALGATAADSPPHVDHVLTRSVVRELADFAGSLQLYADVPYAVRLGWPDWVASTGGSPDATAVWEQSLRDAGIEIARLVPHVRTLTKEERDKKRRALRRYRTQWKALDCGDDMMRFEVLWSLSAAGPSS